MILLPTHGHGCTVAVWPSNPDHISSLMAVRNVNILVVEKKPWDGPIEKMAFCGYLVDTGLVPFKEAS